MELTSEYLVWFPQWCTELEAEVDSGRVRGEKAQHDLETAAKREEVLQVSRDPR